MEVKFKKLAENAIIPKKAKEGDAAWDLTAISVQVAPNYIEYGTGIALEIPKNFVGLLFPRSSVTKKKLMLKNSVGVIDSGYRGEIKFRFQRMAKELTNQEDGYLIGERIGQVMFMLLPEIELTEAAELSISERGEGGYGSTGK